MKEFIEKFKEFETEAKIKLVENTKEGSRCIELANIYNVPFKDGKAEAGCPGIMLPLIETPVIELQWASGFHNPDKTHRYLEFYKALEILDTMVNGHDDPDKFLELSVHGRVMFCNILQKQHTLDHRDDILDVVKPYFKSGLNLSEIPFDKGGVTVSDIVDKYLSEPEECAYEQIVASITSQTLKNSCLPENFTDYTENQRKGVVESLLESNHDHIGESLFEEIITAALGEGV